MVESASPKAKGTNAAGAARAEEGRGAGMSEQRRHRVRLEISREAARLFWEQGVDATSGDQIAEAVGLSTRTIWRHFRSKESCAEPIVAQGLEWEMATLRDWPLHLSLEEQFTERMAVYSRKASAFTRADSDLAMKMILLADKEPALRTAWLMACDQVEREMGRIVADRLGLTPDDLDVRLHAAAATSALRVVSEDIGAALLGGADPRGFADAAERVARAMRRATGGAVGDPVTARPV